MNKRIEISEDILFGKPRVKGTRISVEQVLACLAEGWNYKQIINEFEITEADIIACIDFAYRSLSRTNFYESTKLKACA